MALQVTNVLMSDCVDASCVEILEGAGVSVDYKPGLSKEDLLQCIKVRHYPPLMHYTLPVAATTSTHYCINKRSNNNYSVSAFQD